MSHSVADTPSPQRAVDLFTGEWSSAFPSDTPAVSGGEARLFEDARLSWGIEKLGGVREKTVLELGPLEGGHSYMLEGAGARSIHAIEANTRAYLRCLVVKEIFRLQRVRCALGDFVKFLQTTSAQYDVCVAAGVLYHMREPVELIRLIAAHARAVYCWTHYYDEHLMRANSRTTHRVVVGVPWEGNGFACEL